MMPSVLSLAPFSPALLGLVAAAVALDLTIGDPPRLPHPVVLMGRLIAALERRLNRGAPWRRRLAGAVVTLLVVASSYALSAALLALLSAGHPLLGWAAALWLVAASLAIHGLAAAARAVAAPLGRGELAAARRALAMIVGRDTARLAPPEIARGAVESVAENSVDGITAPLLFALLGGAPLALAYKAINTLDSMIGYRDARYADFGWAAARLDDLANWLPARLTAVALWLVAGWRYGRRGRRALCVTCRQAPRHLSPNSGWPEAMVANLLGVRLGGVNHYRGARSVRAPMGMAHARPAPAHIGAAIGLMHAAWLGVLGLAAALILLKEIL